MPSPPSVPLVPDPSNAAPGDDLSHIKMPLETRGLRLSYGSYLQRLKVPHVLTREETRQRYFTAFGATKGGDDLFDGWSRPYDSAVLDVLSFLVERAGTRPFHCLEIGCGTSYPRHNSCMGLPHLARKCGQTFGSRVNIEGVDYEDKVKVILVLPDGTLSMRGPAFSRAEIEDMGVTVPLSSVEETGDATRIVSLRVAGIPTKIAERIFAWSAKEHRVPFEDAKEIVNSSSVFLRPMVDHEFEKRLFGIDVHRLPAAAARLTLGRTFDFVFSRYLPPLAPGPYSREDAGGWMAMVMPMLAPGGVAFLHFDGRIPFIFNADTPLKRSVAIREFGRYDRILGSRF